MAGGGVASARTRWHRVRRSGLLTIHAQELGDQNAFDPHARVVGVLDRHVAEARVGKARPGQRDVDELRTLEARVRERGTGEGDVVGAVRAKPTRSRTRQGAALSSATTASTKGARSGVPGSRSQASGAEVGVHLVRAAAHESKR
jgi:hypothetical protein